MNLNILPKQDREFVSSAYKKRILVVGLYVMAAVFILGAIVILPGLIIATYKSDELWAMNSSASLPAGYSQILLVPSQIKEKSALVIQNDSQDSISEIFTKIYEEKPVNISLERILFRNDLITIAGTSATRETLIQFEKSIEGLSFVKSSNVPVEDFAKESDLVFDMKIQLKTDN